MANKLFPLSSIAKQIESFAKEMLFSVIGEDVADGIDTEGSVREAQKVLDFCFVDVKFHISQAIYTCFINLYLFPFLFNCMAVT